MLRLWRDQLRIVIAPDRVSLVRLRWRARWGSATRASIPCSPHDASSAWQAPLQALKDALDDEHPSRPANATVVISNHFVRYALVPSSDQLRNDRETEAYCRHRLLTMFGEQANHWNLRWSPTDHQGPLVVSAIENEWLREIQTVFSGRPQRLRSVQPYLMTAFNAHCKAMAGRSCWFVVYEPGRLAICLLHNGQWRTVANRRADDSWQSHLPSMLDHESQLIAMEEECREVMVRAPGIRKPTDREEGYYNFQLLESASDPAIPHADSSHYLMALDGVRHHA